MLRLRAPHEREPLTQGEGSWAHAWASVRVRAADRGTVLIPPRPSPPGPSECHNSLIAWGFAFKEESRSKDYPTGKSRCRRETALRAGEAGGFSHVRWGLQGRVGQPGACGGHGTGRCPGQFPSNTGCFLPFPWLWTLFLFPEPPAHAVLTAVNAGKQSPRPTAGADFMSPSRAAGLSLNPKQREH